MFKAILVLVTMVMMSNANATLPNDKWVAEGVRMIKSSNTPSNLPPDALTISQAGFDTKVKCDAFIADQVAMAPGGVLGTFQGFPIFTTVIAKCSQSQ